MVCLRNTDIEFFTYFYCPFEKYICVFFKWTIEIYKKDQCIYIHPKGKITTDKV